ncbi:MAG: winged helix-turn-helix transcriptional regulator [Clostridia bacterium]|nr:winged helix-turn-helix transcriptional regulator [Clostridia bacterium]
MDKYTEANIVFSKFCNNYAGLKKELPIRPSEMGVLNIIVKREGHFTPVMIAELLDVSKPMVTAHITVLEKKGYIVREYSKDDRRSFYVIPTDKARELVKTTSETMSRYLHQIESALGEDDFETLLRILSDANNIMSTMRRD